MYLRQCLKNKGAALKVFCWNFRGFRFAKVDLSKVNFVVGDNSSGKSSILHLVNLVLQSDLNGVPAFDEELGVDRYDYFSPYFDYAPVSLGFDYEDDKGQRFVKIITVEKRGDVVKVVRATFFFEGTAYTIFRKGSKLQWKKEDLGRDCSVESIFEFHSSFGFRELKKQRFPFAAPNDFVILMSIADMEKSEDIERGFLNFYTMQLDRAIHLAPVRSLPEKYYLLKRTIHASGRHFATLWYDIEKQSNNVYFRRLFEFGKKSGLFDRIRVAQLDKRAKDSPLAVTIRKRGKDLFLNQVGVGVSQLIPVLVELIVAQLQRKSGGLASTILLQQPELHLHPVAQAELGSYIFDVAKNKVPLLIETHSNYLIDRFRLEMKQSDNDVDVGACLLFCYSMEAGNNCVEYNITSSGSYAEPPKMYLEFFLAESMRTML